MSAVQEIQGSQEDRLCPVAIGMSRYLVYSVRPRPHRKVGGSSESAERVDSCGRAITWSVRLSGWTPLTVLHIDRGES